MSMPQHSSSSSKGSSPDEMRQKLESVLGDRKKFIKSSRASFKQFDLDNSNSLSFAECRALIDRLILNLSLPPIDDRTLMAIFDRFNTSEGNELSAEDFSMMFWQILWRVKEKYYPSKNVCVRRSFFVGRTALGADQIKRFFAFERKLGAGSFGEVHLVLEKSSKLSRCCKIINKDKARIPIEQIEAEVTVLKTLDHPNVIKIIEVYEDYNNLYIIQELCEGGEILKRVLEATSRGKVLTEKYVKQIIYQLLSALAYIHDQHIVHKDLKPENILFQDKDVHSQIKVIDFGLAEIFQGTDYSTHAAGTVLYMAPEVHNRRVSIKCDLWSVGCIMYMMLTGHLPFNGRSSEEVRNKAMRTEPAYETYCRHLSGEAVNLIRRLLTKDPRSRPGAREALNHPWFLMSNQSQDIELDPDVAKNLANYAKHSGLKAALINLMAHQLDFNSSQIKKLSELFKRMDRDHSGTLSRSELALGLEKAGFQPWDINKIVQALDVDNSGDISYTEFLAAAYTWREAELNIIWTAFSKLDTDHDGRISVDEFVELLNGPGTNNSRLIDRKDTAQLLTAVDKNGDGVIDWDEFLAYMRNEK